MVQPYLKTSLSLFPALFPLKETTRRSSNTFPIFCRRSVFLLSGTFSGEVRWLSIRYRWCRITPATLLLLPRKQFLSGGDIVAFITPDAGFDPTFAVVSSRLEVAAACFIRISGPQQASAHVEEKKGFIVCRFFGFYKGIECVPLCVLRFWIQLTGNHRKISCIEQDFVLICCPIKRYCNDIVHLWLKNF